MSSNRSIPELSVCFSTWIALSLKARVAPLCMALSGITVHAKLLLYPGAFWQWPNMSWCVHVDMWFGYLSGAVGHHSCNWLGLNQYNLLQPAICANTLSVSNNVQHLQCVRQTSFLMLKHPGQYVLLFMLAMLAMAGRHFDTSFGYRAAAVLTSVWS